MVKQSSVLVKVINSSQGISAAAMIRSVLILSMLPFSSPLAEDTLDHPLWNGYYSTFISIQGYNEVILSSGWSSCNQPTWNNKVRLNQAKDLEELPVVHHQTSVVSPGQNHVCCSFVLCCFLSVFPICSVYLRCLLLFSIVHTGLVCYQCVLILLASSSRVHLSALFITRRTAQKSNNTVQISRCLIVVGCLLFAGSRLQTDCTHLARKLHRESFI